MKKLHRPSAALLAMAALGGVSTHALGQSSVTLYGIVDTGLVYQSKTSGNSGALKGALDGGWAPSIWGLKGQEDIGGGTKIGFALEDGFSTTTGQFGNSNGGIFGRHAYVQATGGFGDIKAGLQFSPFLLAIDGRDPRAMSNFASAFTEYLGKVGINGIFDSNSLVYTSPTFAGFTGSVQYAPGGIAGSGVKGRRLSGSLTYAAGPFSADAAYYQAKDTATGQTAIDGATLGASYSFESVTGYAFAIRLRNNEVPGNPNYMTYAGGLSWNPSASILLDCGVYYSKDRSASGSHSLMYSGGAMYSLSRRTSLYAQVALVNNHGGMGTGVAANGDLTRIPDGNTLAASVGIQHRF
ncbi:MULTISPECIES: porin [Burkholderia]|uniref:porin n=1 Tax=Burkholderia TaxID=32008 RepID=UPI0007C69C66|nr:porin [Burkholderia cepacia]MDN7441558.1 porin [Burkholderia cepacia]MDW9246160.1 gram-negative porin family protein [Burkholderia cepacia]CAG9268263.1 Porin_4 domain-containing protein [Burkholderia cepacia]